MNRSSETIKDISSLAKLNKAALIDWVVNSAEPQVMMSCMLTRLSSMPVDDETRMFAEELRDITNQMPVRTREIESKPKSKKTKVCKVKCEDVNAMFESLIGRDFDYVKQEIMELDKDTKNKMLEPFFNKVKDATKLKSKERKQELAKLGNIFKALVLSGELEVNERYKDRLSQMMEFYGLNSGFGHASLQSYRRRLKSKSKSKSRKSKSKKSRKSKSRKSKSKKSRKSKSRKSKNKSKSKFGKIYGLQNGPDWKGVFPMDLNVVGTLPTLLFGKSSKRKSAKRSAKKLRRKSRKSFRKHSAKGRKRSAKKSKGRKRSAKKSKGRKRSAKKSKKSKYVSFGAYALPKTILR